MYPKNSDYIFWLAELLWQTNQKHQAQKLLTQHILLIGAENESVWIRLSHFYAQKKKINLSFNTLQAGLSAHPKSFELRLTLSRMMVEKKKYSSAITQLLPSLISSEMKLGSNINNAKLLLSKSFLAIGELNKAKKYSDAYLKEHPQSEDALFIKGMIDLLNNDPRNATSKFWSILDTNPLNDAARVQLADAMSRTNQWQKAIEILTEGVEKSKSHTTFHNALFQVHLQLKNYIQAETQLNEILSKNPNDIRTMLILADFYRRIGAYEKARRIYAKISDNQPLECLPYLELSKLYVKEKNYDNALKQLKKGLAILPESKELLLELTKILIKTGKYDLSVNIVEERLEKNPREAFALLLKGKIYASMGEYEISEKAFQKAIRLKPNYTKAYIELMELWYHQKKKDQITTYYHALVKNKPNTIHAGTALAEFYVKEQAYPKAIELYESIIEKNSDGLLVLNLISLLCEHPRSELDPSNALTLAKEALQNNPGNPVVLDMLGWAYYHNGDLNRAQGYLYHSLDIDPNEPMTLYHLAKVTLEVGQLRKAIDVLERALILNKDFSEKDTAQKMLKDLLPKKQFKS
jgi:tetratricopeptide (TPR) repeat protein